MKEYIDVLAGSDLFSGINPDEIAKLVNCLQAKKKNYKKDDFIIEDGGKIYDFGIVLSGTIRTLKWDEFTDKIFLVNIAGKSASMGVMCAASLEHISPVSVQADDDVSVMFFSFDQIFNQCEKKCPSHSKFLKNYVNAVAGHAVYLYGRIECLIKPTIREKILNFLKYESRGQNRKIFSISVNRNHMAEYLNVDRSALSRELSNMKKDGLIDYHKDSFKLLL